MLEGNDALPFATYLPGTQKPEVAQDAPEGTNRVLNM